MVEYINGITYDVRESTEYIAGLKINVREMLQVSNGSHGWGGNSYKEGTIVGLDESKYYSPEKRREFKVLDTAVMGFKNLWLMTEGFADCPHLEILIVSPSLKIKEHGRLSQLCKLDTIVFADGCESIPNEFAMDCIKLRNIMITNQVRVIGERAFYGCSALEAVIIPPGVRELGKEAFFKCPNLHIFFKCRSDGYYEFKYKHAVEIEINSWQDALNITYGTTRIEKLEFNKHTFTGKFGLKLYNDKQSTEEHIEIPASICGAPVLQLDIRLLYENSSVKSVDWKCHYLLDYINMEYFPYWIEKLILPQAKRLCRGSYFNDLFKEVDKYNFFNLYLDNYKTDKESMLETIRLPDGLIEICESTFYRFTHLKRIEFPSSLEIIGDGAFAECVNLKEIIFHNSPVTISPDAFAGCVNLERVEFGERVIKIRERAFASSSLLKEVLLPNTTEICKVENNSSFSDKTKVIRYTGKLLSPDKLETNDGAKITYIAIKEPWTWRAVILSVIPGPEGKVRLPEQICDIPVTVIGDGAIAFRHGLKELVIPECIGEIGMLGIYGCKDLEIIYIEHENSIPVLSKDSISRNPSAVICVKNLQIKGEVDSHTRNCRTFSLAGDDGMGVSYSFHMESGELRISGSGPMKSYKDPGTAEGKGMSQAPWSSMVKRVRSLVLEGFETVGAYAFRGLEQLSRITLNEGIKWISQFAFADCPSLRDIQFPHSLIKIYSHAFYNCEKLQQVTFPEKLELIGSHSFFKTALKTVTIPQSVKTLGTSAFMECRQLKEVYLEGREAPVLGSTGSPVNTVFCNAAEDCVIYTKIMNFSSLANNCNHTTKIVEPEGSGCGKGPDGRLTDDVKWQLDYDGCLTVNGREPDGRYAMMDYWESTPPWADAKQPIRSVRIGTEVKEIGAFAFWGCEMEELILGEVEIIREQAFSRCFELKSIRLPVTLKRIEKEAFAFLDRVQHISYDGTESQFGHVEWDRDILRMSNTQMIQCEDKVHIRDEAAYHTIHMEYQIFGKDAVTGEKKMLTPMRRVKEKIQDGINGINICTYERGEAASCLEGSCSFLKTGKQTELETIVLKPVEEGQYQIEGAGGALLAAVELCLSSRYRDKYQISYQICIGEKEWSPWKWDGERAESGVQVTGFEPITNIRIRLDEKREQEPGFPVVCYRAGTEKNYNWPALNGETVDGGGKNINFLWLTCTIDGEAADCLVCEQHLEYEGDQPVPYWDSHYCFGKENLRLEAVNIKFKPGYEDFQILFCVDVEGKGWQEWKKEDSWAGTKGKSTGIRGIKITVRRRE